MELFIAKQEARNPMFFISPEPYTFDEYCAGRGTSSCVVRSSMGWTFEGKPVFKGDQFSNWTIEKENGEAIVPTSGTWDCWLGYWHPLKFESA